MSESQSCSLQSLTKQHRNNMSQRYETLTPPPLSPSILPNDISDASQALLDVLLPPRKKVRHDHNYPLNSESEDEEEKKPTKKEEGDDKKEGKDEAELQKPKKKFLLKDFLLNGNKVQNDSDTNSDTDTDLEDEMQIKMDTPTSPPPQLPSKFSVPPPPYAMKTNAIEPYEAFSAPTDADYQGKVENEILNFIDITKKYFLQIARTALPQK